ncbi:tripartite tricarboxylate transporter substrate binding protein [Vineibacter terrae]|uniref:Tripartite tricarboxylate transporter substrate binding protein n=1 Tax=Vineibacter terrae TaxID=2586908 RepID=A0A5C8PAU6_9HYPH|nr:tripartite tricarboxylate transporter substrate binding protein [Vineibacter terrae]TXL70915.1 tripartite tricarboxylate transporter substrate binding protein [Vineibacter terrae]
MRRIRRRSLVQGASLLAGAGLLSMPAAVRAQAAWPTRTITIIVNFAPGGLTDGIARVFGEYASKKLGQQIVIDNKPGAGGNIGAALVARAAPDGYTFLHTVSGTMVQNRVLYSTLGFDPDKDFVPVSATSSGELPVAVHKSVPVSSIAELIDYARRNKVSFGSWAPGSAAHIVCAKLNELYGLQMEVVHYRGEGPMWQDMGSGSLQAAMGSYQALRPLLVNGTIRLIALPARRRNAKFADLPTMTEQGYTHAAFSQFGWLGLFAPAGTPPDVVRRMSALWVEAADSEGGRKMYDTFGLHEKPLTHEEMAADYERLKARMLPLVRELGVKLE